MINRRSMLAILAATLLMGNASLPVMAEQGSGGGGSSGGGGGNSGPGGGGSSGPGGGGNSGPGGGGSSGPGGGGNSGPGGGDDDHDDDDQKQASDARKRGQASSLKDVLGLVQRRYKGKVVDVKFANRQNAPTYRIKLIDEEGRLITVSVDARTRRILKTTGL